LQSALVVSLWQVSEKKGVADQLLGQCKIDLAALALGDTKEISLRCAAGRGHGRLVLIIIPADTARAWTRRHRACLNWR
jgi:hypothetical protein